MAITTEIIVTIAIDVVTVLTRVARIVTITIGVSVGTSGWKNCHSQPFRVRLVLGIEIFHKGIVDESILFRIAVFLCVRSQREIGEFGIVVFSDFREESSRAGWGMLTHGISVV